MQFSGLWGQENATFWYVGVRKMSFFEGFGLENAFFVCGGLANSIFGMWGSRKCNFLYVGVISQKCIFMYVGSRKFHF